MLTGRTLNFYFTSYGMEKHIISLISLCGLPYAFRIIFAKVTDALFSKLGMRFIFYNHLLLGGLCIANLFFLKRIEFLIIITFVIAVLGTIQDISFGIIRSRYYDSAKQTTISAFFSSGYRVGMIIAGPVIMFMSGYIEWKYIYLFMGMLIIFLGTMLSKYYFIPKIILSNKEIGCNRKIHISVVIICIFVFLVLYKLADNFLGVMLNPFFKDMGFSMQDISLLNTVGMISVLLGSFLSIMVSKRFNIVFNLIFFGVLHSASIVIFVFMVNINPPIYVYMAIIFFSAAVSGIAMSNYIAAISIFSEGSAYRYSFFGSIMGISRVILPSISGFFVASVGWSMFFMSLSLIILPVIITLLYLKKSLFDKTRLIG